MKVLHQIGDRALGGNFNSLEEILAYEGPMSFDGVYQSVYENYKALKGKEVTFFFSGKYLGGDNSFDIGQPFSRFCTFDQIVEMAVFLDAKIGYHGWAHLRCPELTDNQIRDEIRFPLDMLAWKRYRLGSSHAFEDPILAWPYGDYDARCLRIAEELGYKEAWSVYPKGWNYAPTLFQKNRYFLNWDHYDEHGRNLGKMP